MTAPNPPPHAVTRPTPAMQQTLRLLQRNPYAAALVLPRETAAQAAPRILNRYPTTTAHRNVRSALRRMGVPAVSALLLPPDQDAVTLLLLANVPPDQRERWTLADDPNTPLTWRRYEVARAALVQAEIRAMKASKTPLYMSKDRLTWRLSNAARQDYRVQLTRTIQNGRPAAQQAAALAQLGTHLMNLPGAHGIRADVWMLALHMRRLWRRTHPGTEPPDWGRLPYWKTTTVTTAPLADCWPPAAKEPR